MRWYKQTDSNSRRTILNLKKFYSEDYSTKIQKRKDKAGYTVFDLFLGEKR